MPPLISRRLTPTSSDDEAFVVTKVLSSIKQASHIDHDGYIVTEEYALGKETTTGDHEPSRKGTPNGYIRFANHSVHFTYTPREVFNVDELAKSLEYRHRDVARKLNLEPSPNRGSEVLEAETLKADALTDAPVQDSAVQRTPQPDPGPRTKKLVQTLSHVRAGTPIYPPSYYQSSKLPITKERDGISQIVSEWRSAPHRDRPEEYPEVRLTDFAIYRGEGSSSVTSKNMYEMVSLHHLGCKLKTDILYFDGILERGSSRIYVERVPFKTLSLAGYRDADTHSVLIWIQSIVGEDKGIWYTVSKPHSSYQRYHNAFLWVAELGKHFIDYISEFPGATFHDFRRPSRFRDWLFRHHHSSADFRRWIGKRKDFGTSVIAFEAWLWKEAFGVDKRLHQHPVWSEFRHCSGLTAIKLQPEVAMPTIVTPFVYRAFKHMYFGQVLQPVAHQSQSLASQWHQRLQSCNFATTLADPSMEKPTLQRPSSVQIGDVVAIAPDKTSRWRDSATLWFAYIKNIIPGRRDSWLQVIWLYSPEHTTCGNMFYPYRNELFWSSHCNCDCEDAKIGLRDVLYKTRVVWSPRIIPTSAYFIRQVYRTERNDFVTLRDRDLHLPCCEEERVERNYQPGDAVLYSQNGAMEPCVLVSWAHESEKVTVRQLLRRKRDFGDLTARRNELVWTENTFVVNANQIQRRCNIRFYLNGEEIPTPYDRDGQGDCFYVTSKNNGGILEGLSSIPPELNQGFDPRGPIPTPRLKALSLFSGGGNFDRGLEEGGVMDTICAVEWKKEALHSYRACCEDPSKVKFYLGSVDDHLLHALRGTQCAGKGPGQLSLVPNIGEVSMIVAGSPCQGFSLLQKNPESRASMTNASKVATVLAYIDHYRPAYAILENVPAMTRPLGEKKQNVFAQAICTLVAMGYQVQPFMLNAWNHGGSQTRTRLFVTIAAPGLTPLSIPPITHGHPPNLAGTRAIGTGSNGERFGAPDVEVVAPFPHVSAAEATADLPRLGAGLVDCVEHPSHRLLKSGKPIRDRIASMPADPLAYPRGCRRTDGRTNISMAARAGFLTGDAARWWARQSEMRRRLASNAWTRTPGHRLFPAVTAIFSPGDAKAGFGVHWEEQRVYSLAEARRAQGFRDEEPIVGSGWEQWRVVGNSVAREMALALGLSLRWAWAANGAEDVRRVAGGAGPAADGGSSGVAEDGREGMDWSPEVPSANAGGDVVVLVPHADCNVSVGGVGELGSGASSLSGTNSRRTKDHLVHQADDTASETASPRQRRFGVVYDSDDEMEL
jgi:DNA (cytosine-5)-methyltransferase 1